MRIDRPSPALALVLVLLSLVFPHSTWAVPLEGQTLLIAAPSPLAAQAGEKIALQGGNAVDVAVTVALALAVTSPYYAAFGGGGFALIQQSKGPQDRKKNPAIEVIDFRETAPLATSAQFYTDREGRSSQDGGAAVAVPGVAAGLWALHRKHGRRPWHQLFREVLPLAAQGFRVSGEWYRLTSANKARFNSAGKKYFFRDQADAVKPGLVLRQPQLAKFLRMYQQQGANAFYHGPVARDIVSTVQKTGGVLSDKDLATYAVRWLQPLSVDFAGHTVHLMPPPSSGGVVIAAALKLIELTHLKQYSPMSTDELHVLAEIMKRSFRGRSQLGDPDFHQNPTLHLLSDGYLKPLAQTIDLRKTSAVSPLDDNSASREDGNTTHFSVLDREGNAVAMTITLNGSYGSGVVTDVYGIALNNEMDDFTTRPGTTNQYALMQGFANRVQPGKRPLSSMSPTLVSKDGQIVMSLGAPGGPRIINGVLQALYRTLVQGWDMDRAIQAPRIHHQFFPDVLFFDEALLQPATLDELQKRGHKLQPTWIAKVYGVRKNTAGWLEAAFDARGEGGAAGH